MKTPEIEMGEMLQRWCRGAAKSADAGKRKAALTWSKLIDTRMRRMAVAARMKKAVAR